MKDDNKPMPTVAQTLIGSGPGSASRPSPPTIRPEKNRRIR
jgi:hypothetical protein